MPTPANPDPYVADLIRAARSHGKSTWQLLDSINRTGIETPIGTIQDVTERHPNDAADAAQR